jgi:hypothetical protein
VAANASGRSGEAARCCRGAATAELRRRNASNGVLASDAAYGLWQLAQKGEGTVLVLTEGLDRAELQRRVVGVDGERRRTDGSWGGGHCRASPGLLIRQGDAQPCCEQESVVWSIHGSTAVRNYGGGPSPPGRIAGRNPVLARLGPGKASSTSLLGSGGAPVGVIGGRGEVWQRGALLRVEARKSSYARVWCGGCGVAR